MNLKRLNEALKIFFEHYNDVYYEEEYDVLLEPVDSSLKDQVIELASKFDYELDFEDALIKQGIEYQFSVDTGTTIKATGKTVEELIDVLADKLENYYVKADLNPVIDDFTITDNKIIVGYLKATLYDYIYDEDEE